MIPGGCGRVRFCGIACSSYGGHVCRSRTAKTGLNLFVFGSGCSACGSVFSLFQSFFLWVRVSNAGGQSLCMASKSFSLFSSRLNRSIRRWLYCQSLCVASWSCRWQASALVISCASLKSSCWYCGGMFTYSNPSKLETRPECPPSVARKWPQ